MIKLQYFTQNRTITTYNSSDVFQELQNQCKFFGKQRVLLKESYIGFFTQLLSNFVFNRFYFTRNAIEKTVKLKDQKIEETLLHVRRYHFIFEEGVISFKNFVDYSRLYVFQK